MNAVSNTASATPDEVQRDLDRSRGHAAGVRWVDSGRATTKQLRRLDAAPQRYGATFDWEGVVTLLNVPSNPGTGVGLYQDIVNVKKADMSNSELYEAAKDFWATALGDDDAIDWIADGDFALGFCEGAMGAFAAKA